MQSDSNEKGSKNPTHLNFSFSIFSTLAFLSDTFVEPRCSGIQFENHSSSLFSLAVVCKWMSRWFPRVIASFGVRESSSDPGLLFHLSTAHSSFVHSDKCYGSWKPDIFLSYILFFNLKLFDGDLRLK